jgi:hypothetical protein
MNDSQIESLLRKAPRPTAPAGLLQQLQAGIRLPGIGAEPEASTKVGSPWRRWFPALAFGVFFLGCFILLGVQTAQLLRLRREHEALRAATANLEPLRRDNAELETLRLAAPETERRQKEQEEGLKLRSEATRLRAAAGEVTVLRADNQRLQAERAAAAAKAGIVREEDPTGAQAQRISCINNLKQICLAARLWANEHRDHLPMDFLSITNELSTPKILTCPADAARPRAVAWQDFDGSSVSYEMLSPGAPETDPAVVYVRCPLHQNVGLCDGSAQMLDDTRTVQNVEGKFKIVRLQGGVPKRAPQP